MISIPLIVTADEWLDEKVSADYQNQPLAQDWARVGKVIEELGEAIEALIRWTGQNPRKPIVPDDRDRMLEELGDTALTAVLAIQHYTKDEFLTLGVMAHCQQKIAERATAAGYSVNT